MSGLPSKLVRARMLRAFILSLLLTSPLVGQRNDSNEPMITRGPDGKLVYQPYTNRGDRIIDFSFAGYKANEAPIPDVAVVKTLEPLPDSPNPELRREERFLDPESLDLDDGSPILATPGGRRAHALDCPVILEAEREGRPVVKVTRRMAVRTWVYCDQCPRHSREDYQHPHWIRGGSPVERKEMAYPEGPDSHERIQAALDEIAAMEPDGDGIRGALLLKRGTYYINGTLNLRAGVVLRGEGQGDDGTILIFNNPMSVGIQGSPAGGGGNQSGDAEVESRIRDAYVPAGSTQLTLEDVSGFEVGDRIRVMKRVNDNWTRTLDMQRFGWRAQAYARQLMHFREITRIEGNRIHFRVPLPQSFMAEHGGGSVIKGDLFERARQIGVEDLSVVSNYNTLVPGVIRMNPGRLYEGDMWDNLMHGITLNRCEDSWVRRVTVMHASRASVMLTWCLYTTVRDAESINPISPITGTMRYSFRNNNSQMVLYYNCFAERGRHDFVTGAREAGPIAFVKGRTDGALGPSETHHRWTTGVLFDTITMENGGSLQVVNRGGSGSGHGWSGANSVIWNSSAPAIRVQNPPTPEQNFAIGSRSSRVQGNGFVGNTGDPVESQSLFLQQLVDRTSLRHAAELDFGNLRENLPPFRPVRMGADGALEYEEYAYTGDRIMDFSYAGFRASAEPIPFVRVVETLEPMEGEVTQVGTMAYPQGPDSRERIQAALDRVAAMEPDASGFRGAVFLSKGTYYVNGGLHIRSGVVLRGEGQRGFGTNLIFDNPMGAAITLGSEDGEIRNLHPTVRISDDHVPVGSRRLRVEDTRNFVVGDTVHVRKTVNQAWVNTLGLGDSWTHSDGHEIGPWAPEVFHIEHLRRVAGVEGDTLVLDVPLPQSFVSAHGGGEVNRVAINNYSVNMGVEGLRITSNYDTAITSEVDATDGPYSADEGNNLRIGLHVLNSANAWVRSSQILHTSGSAVNVQDSYYVTVRDTNALEPVSEMREGRRQSFRNSGSSMTLFYNCFAEGGRQDFASAFRDAGPIAFVRGRTTGAQHPSVSYHGWATGLLFDSITMRNGGALQMVNRGAAGRGIGWSGANSVIWNSTAPFIEVENPPTPEQNFALGSTATAPEDAPFTGVSGNGFVESAGTPLEPQSLFEQQLIDRIGKQEATLVLAESLSQASLPMQVRFPRPVVDGVIQGSITPEQAAFEEADQRSWQTVMSDDGTGDWTEQWFLDGEAFSSVTNSPDGMELKASEDHMVLWTKESFEGDLKIEYTFTRTDTDGRGVCILYIQATGRGDAGYAHDITEWNDYREQATMSHYFRNMHLYHISYACGYVRGRRYNPEVQRMNTFSELTPEYLVDADAFFEPGVPYRITFIKTDRAIRMRAVGPEKALYFMLDNEKWPEVTEGRIGLRQMHTRESLYKDFKVGIPAG